MSRPYLLFCAVSLLVLTGLSGCGGGGGGSSKGGGGSAITYQTLWNQAGAGPQGISQRISIVDSTGALVSSKIINKSGASTITNFTGLKAGTYIVTAELNNAADFTGTTTGTSATVLVINGASSFTTDVGPVPTQTKVTPATATITVQSSEQFEATTEDAAGHGCFIDPNAVTWLTLGGVASVNSTGIVLGTTAGGGSVQATYVPLNLKGAAVLTITPFVPVHTKWTVLVYMNAANDLDPFGDLNANQMETVAGNPNVRFILQWKQAVIPGESDSPSFVGTRRYLLQHDTDPNNIHSTLLQDMGTGVDMGSWHTLHDFIAWGQTFYPSDRTVLVIWNHGNGWHRGINTDATRGVSYDDDMGTSIQTWELNEALGTSHLDILAWDASLMQMLEVDNEIRDKAALIVGSEESPPGAGYPYDTIFKNFDNTPDATTLTLAKTFVDETLAVPDYVNDKITQSVVEGDKLADVETAIYQLAQALIAQQQLNPTDFALYVQTARLNAQTYSQSSARTYRDIVDLTNQLDKTVATYTPPASITNADAAVRAAIAAAVLYNGHNANSPNSNGLSIDFSPNDRFATYQSDYELLKLAQDTHWDEWLSVAP